METSSELMIERPPGCTCEDLDALCPTCERRLCYRGAAGVHHPDKTGRRCVACKVRLVDTLYGWLTK